MTATIQCQNTDSISLEEYIDFCESHPEMKEPDAAINYANRLKALCNHQAFFADFLNRELKNLNNFQKVNDFKPPTFVLHYGSYYTIRCVVWLPLEEVAADELLSYYDGHDHNFDFLTCGLYGPGYRTVIYEYDHESVIGLIGEKVDLRFLEDTDLPIGKLMYYFASKDVHTQYPPEELSISANLILPQPGHPALHYFFDVKQQTIIGHVNELSLREPIFRTVAEIGDENSIDLLLRIASQHPCFRTRSMAWCTLLKMRHSFGNEFYEQAMSDGHPYVQQVVQATRSHLPHPS